MRDRISQIIQHEKLTNAEFAEKIGVSASSLSHILGGRNNPSLEVVMKIHKTFPYVNLEWLLYGEGSMENQSAPEPVGIALSETLENPVFPSKVSDEAEYRKEIGLESPALGSKATVKEEIRYIERPQRKITEIRIFFDNGTYETFRPEK